MKQWDKNILKQLAIGLQIWGYNQATTQNYYVPLLSRIMRNMSFDKILMGELYSL